MTPRDRMSPKLTALVDRLRAIIMDTRPGMIIGQEADLCTNLGCTRAMLRQASRLLEFQGLLVVRRGSRGGYYSSRPSAETIIASAAIYFEARKTSFEEVMRGSMTFTIEAMRLACECPNNHPARRKLRKVREDLMHRFPEDMDALEFAADEVKVDEVIFEMVNNAPLELLIKILNRISVNDFGERLFVRQPTRRMEFRQLRFELVDALLRSDANAAASAMAQLNGCVMRWMQVEPQPAESPAVVA